MYLLPVSARVLSNTVSIPLTFPFSPCSVIVPGKSVRDNTSNRMSHLRKHRQDAAVRDVLNLVTDELQPTLEQFTTKSAFKEEIPVGSLFLNT